MSRRDDTLETLLPDGLPEPLLDRQPIALRVAGLLRKYHALDRWREMVRAGWAESDQRNRVLAQWEQKRQEYCKLAAARNRGRRRAGRHSAPPSGDSCLETERIGFRDKREEWVSAYPPPELRSDARPPIGSLLPLRWPLSMAGCYTVLAAIH